jgi:hypothetical protein
MRRMPIGRLITALTIAGAATLGMAACTGGGAGSPAGDSGSSSVDQPGDGGQSTADACALVQQTISDAADEFQSTASDDPTIVVESMKAAAATLGETSAQVTNDEIAALLPPLRTAFETAAEVMQAVADGDASKLADSARIAADIQEPLQKFQEICTR